MKLLHVLANNLRIFPAVFVWQTKQVEELYRLRPLATWSAAAASFRLCLDLLQAGGGREGMGEAVLGVGY